MIKPLQALRNGEDRGGLLRVPQLLHCAVLDSNDSDYRDTMSKEQFHMFKRDYRDSEYVTYYKLPSEIVVVLA